MTHWFGRFGSALPIVVVTLYLSGCSTEVQTTGSTQPPVTYMSTQVGDCVQIVGDVSTQNPDVRLIRCDSPRADYQVVGIVGTNLLCEQFDGYTGYAETPNDRVYCVAYAGSV